MDGGFSLGEKSMQRGTWNTLQWVSGKWTEIIFLTCALLSGLSPGSAVCSVCFEDLFLLDRRMNKQINHQITELTELKVH